MDPTTFDRTIAEKINEYAKPIPRSQREDFCQDMWTVALAANLRQLVQELDGPPTKVGAFLNVTFFRARENWLTRRRIYNRKRDAFEALAHDEPLAPRPDLKVEIEQGLRDLVASLKAARYSEQEIDIVLQGLKDGEMQKDIAEKVGRSPQLLNLHLASFRSAA